jgi:hypothetical protein
MMEKFAVRKSSSWFLIGVLILVRLMGSRRVQPVNFLFNQTRATLRFPFAVLCILAVRVFVPSARPFGSIPRGASSSLAAKFIHS